MVRFQTQKTYKKSHTHLLSAVLFLGILLLCLSGVEAISKNTQRQQRENLERAIHRAITYNYATEGVYPESLDAIIADYGLTYDDDTFFVDYKIVGSNIYPDVTILEKGEY